MRAIPESEVPEPAQPVVPEDTVQLLPKAEPEESEAQEALALLVVEAEEEITVAVRAEQEATMKQNGHKLIRLLMLAQEEAEEAMRMALQVVRTMAVYTGAEEEAEAILVLVLAETESLFLPIPP